MKTHTVYGRKSETWEVLEAGLTEQQAWELMDDLKGRYVKMVAKKEPAIVLKVEARYTGRCAVDDPKIVEVIENGEVRKSKDTDFGKACKWLMDHGYVPFGQPVMVAKKGYFKTYKHTYRKETGNG